MFNISSLFKRVKRTVGRRRKAKETLISKERYTQIIEALLAAQEHDRQSVALELRDNICQLLAAIRLNLAAVMEHPEKAQELLEKTMRIASMAAEEGTKLAAALMPAGNIQDLGLAASVEALVTDIASTPDIAFSLDMTALDETLLVELQKIMLYRIVQERLENIMQSGTASVVNIKLHTKESQVRLIIRDNGKGHGLHASQQDIGIANIMSSAQVFNGRVLIDAFPGQGNRLEVMLDACSQLLRPQAADGIGQRSLNSLKADGDH